MRARVPALPARVLIGLACANGAWASQPGSGPGPADEPQPPPADAPAPAGDGWDIDYEMGLGGSYTLKADFDEGQDGSLSIWRSAARVGASGPLGQRGTAGLTLRVEYSNYDFSGNPTFVDPGFDDVIDIGLRGSFAHVIDGPWSLFGGVEVSSAAELQADFSSALALGIGGGVQYRASETLSFGLGVAARTRLEDNAFVFPVFVLDWRINDRWRLGNLDWRSGTGEGPGIALTYAASDSITVGVGTEWQFREYRFAGGGPLGEGALTDQRVPVAAGVRFRPGDRLTLRARAAVDLFTQIETFNQSGASQGEFDVDPALSFSLDLAVRF
jgi:hypothetical protein